MVSADYLRQCAAFYARLHWPIFPLHPIRSDGRCGGCGGEQCAGKHPTTSGWQRTIAGTPDTATAIWRPDAGARGIGLVCGARAGAWALDVDLKTNGLETLRDLESTHGPLPQTWRARTGSGGEHRFFRALDDRVRNSAGQVAPGLDIRGEGGYVVLPPSPHRSGSAYEWIDAPHKTPLADAPNWLTNLALMRPQRQSAPRRNGGESLKMIAAGKRHDALVSFCGLLRSCGLGEQAIVECGFALLRHHAAQDPPMDLEHAERSMRSVARAYPPTPPGVA